MARDINQWITAYGESHQNPTNKKIHWICVPLIMLSLLGLLWPISLGSYEYVNATTVLIFFVSIYYFRLSISMGIGMLLISFAMLSVINYINQHHSYEAMIEIMIKRTRDLVKRQKTWFNALESVNWIPITNENLPSVAFDLIKSKV